MNAKASMDRDYSKRELDHMFQDIHNRLDKQDVMLVKIFDNGVKHNGRMTKIERWQSYIQGALAILGIFIVPVLGWVLFQIVNLGNLDDKISIGVAKALAEYDIKINQ